MTTLPKALQEKGRQLDVAFKDNTVERQRRVVARRVVVPGSNVVDLVHDLLRKRKTSDPSVGNSSGARCVQQTYPWNWSEILLGCDTYSNGNEH